MRRKSNPRKPKLSARGWKNLVARDMDRIKDLRSHIHALAEETGLEIPSRPSKRSAHERGVRTRAARANGRPAASRNCWRGCEGRFKDGRGCHPRPAASLRDRPDEERSRFQPGISSVQTLKLTRVLGPNVVAMATSMASRPLAISTRPIRGMLLRASKVYQRPPI